ncbi:MAG: hypothetical protein J1D77_06165 [Muribaculaceae bacterium]|nr:hypothetical protein [Muribaculaceae bacterium]
MNIFNRILLTLCVATICMLAGACSKEEDMRMPDDILGVWTPSADTYLEFSTNNSVYRLQIEEEGGESFGQFYRDVYYYEPGYNLVVYLSSSHTAAVYKIVELSESYFTWCWVEDIEATSADSIGQVIGQIINQAQEGFKLDPALYQTFRKISQEQYFSILENLNIDYPW